MNYYGPLKHCDRAGCEISGAGAGWWQVAYGGGPLFVVYPVGKIPDNIVRTFFEVANKFHFCGRDHALEFLAEKMAP